MQRRLMEILWIATFLWVAVSCFRQLQFPDLWWQLDEGVQMLETHSLRSEVRTFGVPVNPVINEYLLFEWGVAVLYKAGGFLGLWFGLGLLALIPFYILGWLIFRSQERFSFWLWLSFFLVFLLEYLRIQQRPEMAANLCQISLGLLLLRRPSGLLSNWQLAMVAVIFAAWANLHGSFIIGFWMLALFFGGLIFFSQQRKPLLLAALKSLAAAGCGTLLNPDGFHRFLLPFQLLGAHWARELTPEMMSAPGLILIMAIPVLLAAFFLLRPLQARSLWLVGLLLSSLALNLTSIRYVNLVAVALWLILAQRLFLSVERPKIEEKRLPIFQMAGSMTAIVAVSLLLFLECSRFKGAVPYVRLDDIGRRAFQDLSWRVVDKPQAILADTWVSSLGCSPGTPFFYPLIHSGISRFQPETLRYAYLMERDPRAFRSALEKLKADYVIINWRNMQWGLEMSSHPNWTCQASGPGYAVFGRNMPAFAQLNSNDPLHQLCQFDDLPVEKQAQALEYLRGARVQTAGWDFLMDWTEKQSKEKLQVLLPFFEDEKSGPQIPAILFGALGKFEEARKTLREDSTSNEGIEAWLNLREGWTLSAEKGIGGDDISTYQLEWLSKSSALSPRSREKLFDLVWFEDFSGMLNKNLQKLRENSNHLPD